MYPFQLHEKKLNMHIQLTPSIIQMERQNDKPTFEEMEVINRVKSELKDIIIAIELAAKWKTKMDGN